LPSETDPLRSLTSRNLTCQEIVFFERSLRESGSRSDLRGYIHLFVWVILLLWSSRFGAEEQKSIGSAAAQQSPVVSPTPGSDEVTIQSETQTRIGKHDYQAKGKVEVRYQDMLLKADEIWGNDETHEVEGQGNVYFEQGGQKIWAEKFKFNFVTKTGIFYRAKGRADPGFIFEAEEVEKLDEDRYRVGKGFVTACEDKVPKWSFHVEEAIIRKEHNARLKKTVFRIKKIPILYSPFLTTPTEKEKRQTGFLIPTTGNSSNKGRMVGDAFYLTLGRSADVLAQAEYFSLRGEVGAVEFNARPNEKTRIYAREFFAIDRQGDGGQLTRILADTTSEKGYHAAVDIFAVSSQNFLQTWSNSFATVSRPDEVSSGFITKNNPDFSLNIFGERRLTLYPGKPVTTRDVPSFDLFGLNRQLKDLPLYWSFDAAIEGLSRTDQYITTSPLVQRFDLHPRLTIPFKKFSFFSFTSTFGFRETFYSERLDPESSTGVSSQNLARTSFDFQGDFKGPSLEKVFDFQGREVKHVIEPEITYRFVSGVGDFAEIIRFDERDVLADTSEVEYDLTNRFFSKRKMSDGSTTTSEVLSIRIGQRYFFDPTFGNALVPGQRNVFFPLDGFTSFAFENVVRNYSPVILRVRYTPAERYAVDFRMDYDPVFHILRAGSLSGSAYLRKGFIYLTYYNTANLPPNQYASNQVRATFGYGNSLRQGFNAAFGVDYDFTTSQFQHSVSQLNYNWDCCGVALEYMQWNFGIRQEHAIRFSFSLKNIGSFGNIRKQERLF
jgi:LPS-assembly protein